LHQGGDELVGHRTPPSDPTEASRQAEGLRPPHLDGELPVAGHLLQHDVLGLLLVSCKPDDHGDAHLDEPDIRSCGHGEPPQLAALSLPQPS
jgi:hypothetical protein